MPPDLYIFTSHANFKIASLLVGFIATICSHYTLNDSPWLTQDLALQCEHLYIHNDSSARLEWKVLDRYYYRMQAETCASIPTERFLLWSNGFLVIFGTTLFFVCCRLEAETVNAVRKRDAMGHFCAGLCLITAGIWVLTLATLIKHNFCEVRDTLTQLRFRKSDKCNTYLRNNDKIICSCLSIIAGILYCVTGVVIEQKKIFNLDSSAQVRTSEGNGAGPARVSGSVIPEVGVKRRSRIAQRQSQLHPGLIALARANAEQAHNIGEDELAL